MINRNWLAYIFITDEDCLSISSKEKNLDRLLGGTLFRQTGDHEKLKAKEIKILSDSYNINYLDFSKYNILTPPLMRTGKAAFGCSIAPSSSIIATIIAHGLSRISVRHAKIKKLPSNKNTDKKSTIKLYTKMISCKKRKVGTEKFIQNK